MDARNEDLPISVISMVCTSLGLALYWQACIYVCDACCAHTHVRLCIIDSCVNSIIYHTIYSFPFAPPPTHYAHTHVYACTHTHAHHTHTHTHTHAHTLPCEQLDCFHPSLFMHELMAKVMWNCMLTPAMQKDRTFNARADFVCPTNSTLLYTY